MKPKLGLSYQKSDINDKVGSSFGIGLFKQLTPVYHWLSTSIGIDYSYHQNSGQNYIKSNTIINRTNPTTNKYSYQNYQSKSHYYAISLELGFQKLKKVTNINLYGFGGIGYLGFSSKTNQKDTDNKLYDYSKIGSGYFDHKTDLNLLYDKTFESDTQAGSNRIWVLSPHLGFGIGYQFTRQISLNFEQKFLLPQTDLLDGNIWTKKHSKSKNNDKLTTTSVTFCIGLGKKSTPKSKNPKTFSLKVQRPFIDMKQPSYRLSSTSNSTYTIKAILKNITDIIQITLEQNGKIIIPNHLSFDKVTGQVSFDTKLTLKKENFKIYVHNAAGNHTRIFSIEYTGGIVPTHTESNKTDIKKYTTSKSPTPYLTILTPSKDYIESCYAFITFFTHSTLNKNQLITLGNNQPIEYTQIENKYTIEKEITGTVTFRIITSADTNKQEKQITYRCRPEDEFRSTPIITVREPLQDTILTHSNSLYLFANFKSKADKVTVTINGITSLKHTYTSGLATNLKLPFGNLVLTIETENSMGRDKKTIFIKRP